MVPDSCPNADSWASSAALAASSFLPRLASCNSASANDLRSRSASTLFSPKIAHADSSFIRVSSTFCPALAWASASSFILLRSASVSLDVPSSWAEFSFSWAFMAPMEVLMALMPSVNASVSALNVTFASFLLAISPPPLSFPFHQIRLVLLKSRPVGRHLK